MSNSDVKLNKHLGRIDAEVGLIKQELHDAVESVLAICEQAQAKHTNNNAVEETVGEIYQACTIHDILRQRLDKIKREVSRIKDPSLPEDDDALLEGPQSTDEGVSEEQIKKLLES